MKIIKKDLKFDMVLDGEKINSLEELREHPSTELLDLQQDGRLSRWVRAHGGANEADQLSALSLTGDKAQDLYAICQILSIDIELEDIKDALEDEATPPQNDLQNYSDINTISHLPIDNPKIDQRNEIFLDITSSVVQKITNTINQNKDKRLVYTNIPSFYEKKYYIPINDTRNIVIEEKLNEKNVSLQDAISMWSKKNNDEDYKTILIDGDEICIYQDTDRVFNDSIYKPIIKCLFIKGNDVLIDSIKLVSTFLCVCAKNIYIKNLGSNNILIGDNIFIEKNRRGYYSSIICAKNMLSIGKRWGFSFFTKSKEELISDNILIQRNSKPNKNLFLSAGTYLYGCEKEGNALESELAIPCYERIKESFNNWIEFNGIFRPKFWKLED